MISTKNTRSQVLPFYRSKDQWFASKYSDPNAYLLYPQSKIPEFQLILGSGISQPSTAAVKRVSDNSTLATLEREVAVYDINYDGVNETIVTYPSNQQNFGGNVSDYAYIEFSLGGSSWYSEPFVMCASANYKLSWTNSCNRNNAYYNDGFTQVIYFDQIDWNRPTIEKEREFNKNGLGIEFANKITQKKIYSFTVIAPDYLIDAYEALEFHDTVKMENLNTGDVEYWRNIRVEVGGDEKEAYHDITIRYEIKETENPFGITLEEPFAIGCCEPLSFETIEGGLGGINNQDCSGFDVNINVTGEVLTYTLVNAPSEGTTLQTWFKDGVPIGNGSSVTMGGFGVYRVQVSKGDCSANDEHTYVDICSNWTVQTFVDGLTITANSSGNVQSVSYEIYNDQDTVIATSLPFTVPSEGTYVLKATMGDCEKDFILNPSGASASHTASIVKSGFTLTGNQTGCSGTLTHRWELDEGNGAIVIGSNQSIEITKNGLYIYYAICDGVEASAQKVILDICTPITICNADEIKTVVNVTGQLDVC